MSKEKDPFDLAGQQRDSDDRETRKRIARHNEADDFKWLMSNRRGRRIVWSWLERTGMFRSSFNHSGSVTSFNEGMRNIGLMIVAQIHENCPEHYLTMLTEARSEDE